MAFENSQLRHLSSDLLDEVIFHLQGFLAAPAFAGARPGRVFKIGDLGLGYYVDNRKPCTIELLQLSSTCKELRQRILPVLLPAARARVKRATSRTPGSHVYSTEEEEYSEWARQNRGLMDAYNFEALCAEASRPSTGLAS